MSAVPNPTGPSSDAIGDACDLNPTVADGHFHTVLSLDYVCITGGGVVDTDGDGVCDADEDSLGSDKNDITSTPEDLSHRTTCDNGVDDDGDGKVDLADSACQRTLHNVRLNPVQGDKKICSGGSPSNVGSFQALIVSPSAGEDLEFGVSVDAVSGTLPAPVANVASIGPVVTAITPITGTTTVTNFSGRALNVDGDVDLEYEARVEVNTGASPVARLQIDVTFPACSGGSNVSAFDYVVSVDVCHGDDIAPMALFGASGPDTCRATADAGQDRSFSNDAPQSRNVDDESK